MYYIILIHHTILSFVAFRWRWRSDRSANLYNIDIEILNRILLLQYDIKQNLLHYIIGTLHLQPQVSITRLDLNVLPK